MRRILQVAPSLILGGAEHVAAYLASLFPSDAPSICASRGGPWEIYLERRNIRYVILERRWKVWARPLKKIASTLYMSRHKGAVGNPSTKIASVDTAFFDKRPDELRRFEMLLRKYSYDVVHIHSLGLIGLATIAKAHHAKVIYGHHNILSQRHSSQDIEFLCNFAPYIDNVVCVSDAAREDFVTAAHWNPAQVLSLPNPSFLATGIFRQRKIVRSVGTVSNLEFAKGIDVLFDAWNLVQQQFPRTKLRIAGGTKDVIASWKLYLADARWSSSVEFLGQLTNQDLMDAYYDSIDLLAVPSRTESFSNQIIEAQSHGIPVVASDIPALKEVTRGTALLFPVENSVSLAECIMLLIRNPTATESMSRDGHKRWTENFSPENIRRNYERVYDASEDNLV